jgi:hypothetical protein
VEGGGTGDQLDILLNDAQLERQLISREGPRYVQ